MAEAPISPRIPAAAVWTGTEVLFWGGDEQGPDGEPRPVRDGAAYDPVRDTWRTIAPAPHPLTSGSPRRVVWTGTVMFVCCVELPGDRFVAMTYRPSTGAWRVASPPPVSLRFFDAAVSMDTKVLILTEQDPQACRRLPGGGSECDDGMSAITYDPGSDRWGSAEKVPLPASGGTTLVWTGSRVLVWGPPLLGGNERPGVGAGYDPVSNGWHELAPSPAEVGSQPAAVWTGSKVLVWGGHGANEPSRAGAIYDPVGNAWKTITRGPLAPRATTPVWTGRVPVAWGGAAVFAGFDSFLADGAAYDPRADRWTRLQRSPLEARFGSVVWAGDRMVVWGGFIGTPLSQRSVADGATWSPSGR